MKRRFPGRWMRLAMLLWAAYMRFTNLGAESLWYDEAYTWWISSQVSFRESINSSIYEIIPPGSYVLWRGWIALTGETEFAMRALSALLGVITVAALGRLVRTLTKGDESAGYMAMLFALLSPSLLWADREVRMYGPLLCMSVLSSMALMQVLFDTKRRKFWLALWSFFSLASLYMTITAAFWLLAQGIFTAVIIVWRAKRYRDRRLLTQTVREFSLPVVAIAAGFLPWVIAALPSLGINTGYWPGTLTLDAFLKTAVQGMTVHQFIYGPFEDGLTFGLAIVGLAALALVFSQTDHEAKLYPLVGLVVLLVQGLVYRTIPKWGLRHATLYAPFVLIALAQGAAGLEYLFFTGRRTSLTRVSYALVILAVYFISGLTFRDGYGTLNYHEDWRAAAAYVQENRLPGDVIIIETGSVYPAWVYYAGDDGVLPLPDEPLLNVHNVLCYENTAPIIDKATRDASQVWLVTWLDNVTDPTGIVPTLLDMQGYDVETPEIHGLGLRHYILAGHKSLPLDMPIAEIIDAELLPDLKLWGYTLPADPIPGDRDLNVLTWWTTQNPDAHTGKFYQASLRLVDARGHTWLKYDAPPGGGDYRPERWTPETPVLGRFDTPLPAGILPGEYTVNLIAYHGGESSEINLGTITITKAETAPALPESFISIHSNRGALTLIGLRLDQQAVKPQDALNGELFWEVQGDLEPVYGYELALDGYHSEAWGIMPDFDATQWQTGDRFVTPFSLNIGARAVDAQEHLEVTLYDARGTTWMWETELVTINASRNFDLPLDARPLDVRTSDGSASLVGYALPERVKAGDPFEVTLYWKAGTPTEIPLSVFLHVTPPDAPGYVITQHDGQPANNEKPLYTWVTDEIIADTHTLPGVPAGTYIIRTGLYNSTERIPLEPNADVQIIDEGVTLPETLVVQ